MKRTLVGALLVAVVACAPAKSPSDEKPQAVDVPAAQGAQAVPEPAEALSYAAIPSDAKTFVHVDGGRFRASVLYTLYGQVMKLVGENPVAIIQKACGFDPLEFVAEATYAGSVMPGGSAPPQGVLAVSSSQDPKLALDCIGKLQSGRAMDIDGAPAIQIDDRTVATVAGKLLLIGDPKNVSGAIARIKSGARGEPPSFAKTALKRDREALIVAALDLQGQKEFPTGGVVTITSTPRRFAMLFEVDMPTEDQARALVQKVDLRQLETQGIKLQLGNIKSRAEGRRFIFELGVDGDPTEQTRVVGTLAALGIHSVRRYLARSKEAEARHTIRYVAKALASHIEAQPAAQRRFPASAPLTPTEAPRGKKVALSSDAWKHPTWQALRFEMSEPVYYAYEIVTSKDGKTATVRAVGDLDGDGTLSKYSLTVKIDASGAPQIAPQPTVENELE